jgi:endonuclease III related protein
MINKFQRAYKELLKKYGYPGKQWIVWCKRSKTKKEKERVIIGAILTQQTNWNNVFQALDNLEKANVKSLEDIIKSKREKIAQLVKPSGFYREKTKYLFNVADFFIKNYKDVKGIGKNKLAFFRKKLINVKGVGKETADSILLYAFEKPVFVIDEYTKRFLKRKKMAKRFSYDYLQDLFQKNIKEDYRLYQNFHALIVIEEQQYNKSQLYK